MKKIALLSFALFLGLVATAQMKYQPKAIVIFKGEKNPTFDESKYPNLTFYYTPGITLKKELAANTKENETLNAVLSVTGIDAFLTQDFVGTPTIFNEVKMWGCYLFDKNVTVTGLVRNLQTVQVSARKNMQGQYVYEDFKSICKNYVKKGNTTKLSKKKLKKSMWDNVWTLQDYIGYKIPDDFEIENKSGEKIMFSKVVKENNLTLVYFLYLNKNFDLNKGKESGAGKTGGEFAGDVISTVAADKQTEVLSDIENVIFGYRVEN